MEKQRARQTPQTQGGRVGDKKFQTASFTESSTGDPAMAISCVTSAIKSFFFFSGLFFHDQF